MKNIIIILLTLLTLNTSAITLSREATISILTTRVSVSPTPRKAWI